MLKANCPNRDANVDIDSIISEKYKGDIKTSLERLKALIKSRYQDYSRIELGERIGPRSFSEEEKRAMHHLYDSQTATAKLITAEVTRTYLLSLSGFCVSCGFGDADQIDHFLPQEHFPEFSILHKNLLPICGTCNEIKGENIPGMTKDYLHLMFDSIPNEEFLLCRITYNDHIPKSHFSVQARFQSDRIFRHFNDLKLSTRLEKKSTQYFLQIRAFKNDLGDAFAIEEIERDLQKTGVLFGTGYWKYLLCKEMISSNFVSKL
ncbi:MAG: hypothetical protein ACKO96_47680 [Flammeovirgaceae bacterium]